MFAGNTRNDIFGPRISVYFSFVTHALVFIPNQRKIKGDPSSLRSRLNFAITTHASLFGGSFPSIGNDT